MQPAKNQSKHQVSLGRAIISDDDGPAGKYLLIQILLFQKTERGSAHFRDVFWRENSNFLSFQNLF